MANKLNFWGLSVITALTAQDFNSVYSMEIVPEQMFIEQCQAIFRNFEISAIKIGVVPTLNLAQLLAKYLKSQKCPIVFDPVIKSTSGYDFTGNESFKIIKTLCEVSTIFTPNIPESEFLKEIMNIYNLQQLQNTLKCAIYLKGGHGTDNSISEYLITDKFIKEYNYKKYKWEYDHGSGCTFSSLLSMLMVENELEKACEMAHELLIEVFEGK